MDLSHLDSMPGTDGTDSHDTSISVYYLVSSSSSSQHTAFYIIVISLSPLEVFNLFFSQDLLEEIVEQSNNYVKTVMDTEK